MALAFGMLTSVGALDAQRMAGLEVDLAPLMENTNAAALAALDAELTPQLTSTAGPLTWVKAGIVSHNLSRAVGSEAHRGNATRAVERLKTVAHGNDPELAAVALTYLGSATSLQATEDSNPIAKIFAVNGGWGILGDAVDKYGDASFLPRMVRVRVGSSLPDFFGKNDDVIKDITALDAWNQAHAGRMPDSVKAQLALAQGNTYKKQKKMDKAVAAWNRVLTLDPQKTGPGKDAAAALERYEN